MLMGALQIVILVARLLGLKQQIYLKERKEVTEQIILF